MTTYSCPYPECDGEIEAFGWLITKDEVRCPKCGRKVDVQHECFVDDEGNCIEWLEVDDG